MPDPASVTPKGTPSANPCACCREKPHDGLPDRDLAAYVCRDCAPLLRGAARVLKANGFPGSTMEVSPS